MSGETLYASGYRVNTNVDRGGFCHPRLVGNNKWKTDLQKLFARRVAEEMAQRAISANELSRAAKRRGYKMSQASASRILSGDQDPTIEKIHVISECLGLPAWFLMTDGAKVEQRVIAPPIAAPQNVVHMPKPDYRVIRPSASSKVKPNVAKKRR